MALPDRFTFTARASGYGDDYTDIEMRSDSEKYTVATVEDRFAPLFLATPALLACAESWLNDLLIGGASEECGQVRMCRAAIAKAKGHASAE